MIGPGLFAFRRELHDNNRREWFEANRERYERDVREPLLRFVRAFEEPLAAISPSMLAVARKSGGSLFRIHRDIRFSADRRPYKSWAALQFRHERGKDVHAPGFYLHLGPGDVFAGAGAWRPDGAALATFRRRIDDEPGAWRAARDAVTAAGWTLDGDRLKTAPRGYGRDHPMIEDIRRRDFVVTWPLTEEAVVRDEFVEEYARLCEGAAPLMRFLAGSLELPF